MEELTKTEERIMQVLWKLRKAFVKDIIDELDENPKPPYNT
ncbi:MAG: BlaI/MecI/CopY family transcriptional regulator, partial [Chryseobacterium sp.]